MNLWAKYLKQKQRTCKIVSISKEPHIIYKLINTLITVQNAERSINNKKIEITNTKHPKQLNTERKKKTARREKKKKTLIYAPKVKDYKEARFPYPRNLIH